MTRIILIRVRFLVFVFWSLSAGLFGFSACVSAAPLLFDDESAFLASPGPLQFEKYDFESESPFGGRVGGGRQNFELAGTMRFEAPIPALKLMDRAYSGNRNISPGGRNYLAIDTDLSRRGTDLEVSFLSPVRGFGFYMIDHDSSDIEVSLFGRQYVLAEVSDGQAVFFGVVFDALATDVKIVINTGKDSAVAMDDWYIASAAVAPSAVSSPGLSLFSSLLAGGLLFWRQGSADIT